MSLVFSQPHPAFTVSSIAEIVEKVRPIQGPLYFRGQEDHAWGLQPTIARLGSQAHAGCRPHIAASPVHQERGLLHRFRRHTYEERGRVLSAWEVLFLARHHGLPVRLLDWTSNPLVALYFACLFSDNPRCDGAIWVLRRRPETVDTPDVDVFAENDPMSIVGVRLIYPFYPTHKMTAQSGLFTLHAPPWPDLTALKQSDPYIVDIESGEKWLVPMQHKAAILRHLERLGINARTLFPDLTGIAQGLVQTETFRIASEYSVPPRAS